MRFRSRLPNPRKSAPPDAPRLAGQTREFRMANKRFVWLEFGAAARAPIEGPFHVRHTVEKNLALYRGQVASRPAEESPPR